jgi:predicted O-methyltransferase YrrM
MSNTLNEPIVRDKLTELHDLATAQKDGQDIYQLKTADRFMAVSPEQGQFLNFIVGLSNAKNIVEFGCSFGISGIYLASAAKDNGGSVITTELEAGKSEVARKNFADAGIDKFVEVRTGDALETLAEVETVDLIFLDGAKELYLPVYQLMYPKLTKFAIVIADNIDKTATHDFVNMIRQADEFNSVTLFDGRMLVAYKKG